LGSYDEVDLEDSEEDSENVDLLSSETGVFGISICQLENLLCEEEMLPGLAVTVLGVVSSD
jgi:hypothetical protein